MAERKTTNKSKTSSNAKPTAKKTTAKNTNAKKTQQVEISEHNQLNAVILFTVALLIAALFFIQGENVWLFFHNVLFGFFGPWAITLPVLMIYVAFKMAKGNMEGEVKGRIILVSIIIIMLCTTAFVFTDNQIPEESTFWSCVKLFYNNGIEKFGSGLAGAALGAPLLLAFGVIGARVTVVLLLFVSIMILTGSTLLQLYRTLSKPVKVVSSGINKVKERQEEIRQEKKEFKFYQPKFPSDSQENEVEQTKQTPLQKFNKVFGIEDDEEIIDEKPLVKEPIVKEQKTKQPLNEHFTDEALAKINKVIKPVENEIRTPVTQTITSTTATPVNASVEVLENASKAAEAFMKKKEEEEKLEIASKAQMALYEDKKEEEFTYCFPPLYLLAQSQKIDANIETEELQTNGRKLVETLKSFGVQTKIVDICRGPSVTRYELQPAAGVKISKITNLADDLALNLAAIGVRIEAPIPGKAAVGIEIPNKNKSVVRMRELLESNAFATAQSKLTVVLGKDIAGQVKVADLSKMPHTLIAGTTGSGKSVCINSLIISLIYKSSPDEVRFLMIDPKVVELGVYNGIPHLLVPVVTDPRKAAGALNWAVTEMLNRYKIFAEFNVKDLQGYNSLAKFNNYLDENGQPMLKMPQIVIIIDELADLMMAAPNEVEDSICRLAQMARAAGMHLVVATQRPTVDVVTGLIKANIPSRIAFAVSSTIDSRTILDSTGAEKLLGQGDMLFSPVGAHKPTRIQGCFVQESEIDKIVEFIKKSRTIVYDEKIISDIEKNAVLESNKNDKNDKGDLGQDPMMEEAIKCVMENGQASTSLLQRRLRLGYARAGRLIDEMEQLGIVGPHEGSKPRQVMISYSQWLERNMQKQDEVQAEPKTE